ncbi:MAG: hypothetical protein ACP5QG_00830 [candidate division WOR-3 bacterium]
MVTIILLVSSFGAGIGIHETYTGFLEAARENDLPAFITAFSGSGVLEWRQGQAWGWRVSPGYMRTRINVAGMTVELEQFSLGAGPVFYRGKGKYWGGLFSIGGLGLVIEELGGAIEAPHYGGLGGELFLSRRFWGNGFGELKLSCSVFPVKGPLGNERVMGFAFFGLGIGAIR